jgi:hypothetical protein
MKRLEVRFIINLSFVDFHATFSEAVMEPKAPGDEIITETLSFRHIQCFAVVE